MRSVVFTWGMPGSDTLPPGGTTVEVTLTPADGGTLVTLAHRGLPAEHRQSHEEGGLPRQAHDGSGNHIR